LQRTEPDSSRRQRGVVEVVQFWQTGCSSLSLAFAFLYCFTEARWAMVIDRVRGDIDNTIDMAITRARDRSMFLGRSRGMNRGQDRTHWTVLLATGGCGWRVLWLAHGVVL